MQRILYILLFIFLFPLSAHALETDLSNRKIEIRYSFEGADLILFGTVGRFDASDTKGNFDVVVVVRGPAAPTIVRQKAYKNGIWINDEEVVFTDAPGYYAVAASRPIRDIASAITLKESAIGFDHLSLNSVAEDNLVTGIEQFKAALYRIREKEGLYRQEVDTVTMRGVELFRTDVRLPANVPVGNFQVDAYIFRDGVIQSQNRIELLVDKEGFERAAYTYAHNYPFLYGLTAVLIALSAGWLAGLAGKK